MPVNVATTKMSSKGQVVIPESVRVKLGLRTGAQFVVLGHGDTIMLKVIASPSDGGFEETLKAPTAPGQAVRPCAERRVTCHLGGPGPEVRVVLDWRPRLACALQPGPDPHLDAAAVPRSTVTVRSVVPRWPPDRTDSPSPSASPEAAADVGAFCWSCHVSPG